MEVHSLAFQMHGSLNQGIASIAIQENIHTAQTAKPHLLDWHSESAKHDNIAQNLIPFERILTFKKSS